MNGSRWAVSLITLFTPSSLAKPHPYGIINKLGFNIERQRNNLKTAKTFNGIALSTNLILY
jgi:hypothetical protein